MKCLKFGIFLLLICTFSCSSGEKEISLEDLDKDFKKLANQNAHNILNLCHNENALKQFKERSSTKMKMQDVTGKQFLLCLAYKSYTSSVELGELYQVIRLKGNVKRFKYDLVVESDTYTEIRLFLDLNSEKFIANYALYGKTNENTWDSLLDKMEGSVKKSLNDIK